MRRVPEMFRQPSVPRSCQSVMKNKSNTSAVALAMRTPRNPQSKLQPFIETVKRPHSALGWKASRKKKNHNNNLGKQSQPAVQKHAQIKR